MTEEWKRIFDRADIPVLTFLALQCHALLATGLCGLNCIFRSYCGNMAVRIIIGSCLVAVVSYLSYQELTFVTVEFSLKMDIPAKRSVLFELLLDNPEFYLKVHPLW